MLLFARRRLLFASVIIVLVTGSIIHAQSTRTWTGLSSPPVTLWTDDGNWDGPHPVSLDTALFNGAGNSVTTISLGAATQLIKTIQFDTAGAAAYTLGALASGDKFSFDAGGAITSTAADPSAQVINADILANGALTIKNSSTTGSLTLAGSISGATGSITYGGALNGVIQVTGQNTYAGNTTVDVNQNTIQIGSSSNSGFTSGPFGTGAIVMNSSMQSPLQAINANQIVANQLNLSGGGFTVNNATTPFNLTFTGPIVYSDIASRTITVNTYGQTFTLGASANSSTITLSPTGNINLAINPSNGALGNTPATLILNDIIQDNVTPPATPDTVSYNSVGNTAPMGIVQINGASTYAGATSLNGQTSGSPIVGLTVQLGVSSTGNPGAITSGPFGKGTLTFNGNSSGPPIVQPLNGDRTIANAVTMTSGFFAANVAGAPFNLSFTGPITLPVGKVLTNNLVSGVALNLGSATSPSTFTATGTLTIQTQSAGGGMTVINDAVSGAGGLTVQNSATLVLTNANTNSGGATVQGTGTPTLLVNNTTGSGTGTGKVTVNGTGTGTLAGTLGGTGFIKPTATAVAPLTVITVNNKNTIAPGFGGIGTLTFDGSGTISNLMSFATGATISDELNNSFQSDKIALVNSAANDVAFNNNVINFTDLSSGTLALGTYTLITSDVAGAYSGLTTNGIGIISAGLSIGTGLEAYTTTTPSLQVVGNNIVLHLAIAGDYNFDGKVDAADYVIWRSDPSDFGGDPGGYTTWRANFGSPAPGAGSGLGREAAVPEPASVMLILFGIVALSVAGTRRRAAM